MAFKLLGLERFKRSSRQKGEAILRGLERGLVKEAEGVMTISKQAYVPVDFGILKGSGFVDKPTRRGRRVVIELGFGGPAAPYAVYVHEDLTAFHTVGEAKYLQKPLRSAKRGMAERLAKEVRAELRRGS